MKTYKSFSAAILVALSLYPPWAGVQNCNAQTNVVTPITPVTPTNTVARTNTLKQTNIVTQTNIITQTNIDNQQVSADTNTIAQTDTVAQSNTETNADLPLSTNRYRARINLVCTTPNANGNLGHERVVTSEFVRQCALGMGATNLDDLALAYNRSNSALEVVNRTTREVVCTPLSFEDGNYLTNANNTRVLVQAYVFFNSDTQASGFLSATQRLAYRSSGELKSFGMRGSIFYNFNDGTNAPTFCQGILAVGSSVSRGNSSQDLDDANDDNENLGNQGQGNNGNGNGNNGNNNNGNHINNRNGMPMLPGFGTTNVNQGGFGTTNIDAGFGITNANQPF